MLTCPRCGYYNSDIATRCEQCNTRISSANIEKARRPARVVLNSSDPVIPPASAPMYAGFWIRGGALVIDVMVLSMSSLFVSPFLPPTLALFVLLLIPAVYETLMEASSGATLGKRALCLRVTTLDGRPISIRRSAGRHFAHYLSGFLLIGYFFTPFNARKRALHDYVAGTVVIKAR